MGQQQLLLIILGVIIVGLAIAVGLSLFSANSIQANKDAQINDLNNLAANAYQYKIRPQTMGGGAGSYVGYTVPSKLSSNSNATYVASGATATAITLKGTNPAFANQWVQAIMNVNGVLGTFTYGTDFQ